MLRYALIVVFGLLPGVAVAGNSGVFWGGFTQGYNQSRSLQQQQRANDLQERYMRLQEQQFRQQQREQRQWQRQRRQERQLQDSLGWN